MLLFNSFMIYKASNIERITNKKKLIPKNKILYKESEISNISSLKISSLENLIFIHVYLLGK